MASRRAILLGLGASSLALAACAAPGRRSGPRGRARSGMGAGDPGNFSHGIELKQAGNFREAIPFFAQVAGMGAGYEVAQYHLGDCFLKQADAEDDLNKAKQKRREGAFWVLLAAQSGNVNAQGRMAGLYFEGVGFERDRAEAGKYLVLAETNPLVEFMVPSIRAGLATMRTRLNAAQLAEAEARAIAFETLEQTQRSFPQLARERTHRTMGGRGGRDGGGRGGGGRRGGGSYPADELSED